MPLNNARLDLIYIDPSCASKNEVAEMARELRGRRKERVVPDMVGDVRRFNQKFGLPWAPEQKPRFLPPDLWTFRERFHKEETMELELAILEGRLDDAADALTDRIYVDIGTAHFMGLPLEEHWKEVQRANMQKEKPTGPDDPRVTSKHRHAEGAAGWEVAIVKPVDWRAPNHTRVLNEHLYIHFDKTAP